MNKKIFYLLLDINNIINNCVNKERKKKVLYKSFDSKSNNKQTI